MKKMVAVLAAFAIVTTAAWAQISFEGMVMGRADLANNFITNHGAPYIADMVGGSWVFGIPVPPWEEIRYWEPYNEGRVRRAFAQEARLFLNMVNADGTAGATARFWNMGWMGHMGWNNASNLFHAWGWWRPMESLLVQVGENPWGFFGATDIVGTGFTGNESENSLLGFGSAGAHHYGSLVHGAGLHRNIGFYGGFIHPGISAAFEPMEGLSVFLAIPFAIGNAHATSTQRGANNFIGINEGWLPGMLRSHIGVRYEIEDIGTVAFTLAGAPGYWGDNDSPGPRLPMFDPFGTGGIPAPPYPAATPVPNVDGTSAGFGLGTAAFAGTSLFANSPKFYLSFLLTAVENIQVNFGLAYTLPFSIPDNAYAPAAYRGVTFNFPVEMGLGFQFDAGDFVVRARLATLFAGSIERPVIGTENTPFMLGFNVHPSFSLGFLVAHLNAGVQVSMNTNDGRAPDSTFYANSSDTVFGWHVNPYITVPISHATVFAGFHAETCGVQWFGENGDSSLIRWRVPVGLRFQW